LLGQHATRLGPGFFIRFTVHYNLFAGSVIAMGSDLQINEMVKRNKERVRLGCFGLTEVFTGVNSGLVVNTIAELIDGEFVINSPDSGAAKNWISQGLIAEESVIAASVIVNGKNIGPQAFLVKLRDPNGRLVQGVKIVDMGKKTVGNDLDNARITFTNFKVPLETLLSRYVEVDANGKIKYPMGSQIKTMNMLGQRLFTGRVAVAQAALEFSTSLFQRTREFASHKECWSPVGKVFLITIPQIKSLFEKSEKHLKMLSDFMEKVEFDLCVCLQKREIPNMNLQKAIAVGKVRCLEDSIALCHALKQEVGSFALMAGNGFEQFDFLQCCKFAEGDSRYFVVNKNFDAENGKRYKFNRSHKSCGSRSIKEIAKSTFG
jgi:acyl-CoA oxidase